MVNLQFNRITIDRHSGDIIHHHFPQLKGFNLRYQLIPIDIIDNQRHLMSSNHWHLIEKNRFFLSFLLIVNCPV